MKTKKFTGDRIFDFVNVTVILLITIIILAAKPEGRQSLLPRKGERGAV